MYGSNLPTTTTTTTTISYLFHMATTTFGCDELTTIMVTQERFVLELYLFFVRYVTNSLPCSSAIFARGYPERMCRQSTLQDTR